MTVMASRSGFEADSDYVDKAAQLYRLVRGDRSQAIGSLFTAALVVAHIEGTTPGLIMEKFSRSQPTMADQRLLMSKLQTSLYQEQ